MVDSETFVTHRARLSPSFIVAIRSPRMSTLARDLVFLASRRAPPVSDGKRLVEHVLAEAVSLRPVQLLVPMAVQLEAAQTGAGGASFSGNGSQETVVLPLLSIVVPTGLTFPDSVVYHSSSNGVRQTVAFHTNVAQQFSPRCDPLAVFCERHVHPRFMLFQKHVDPDYRPAMVHVCEKCEYKTGWLSNLRRHMRTVHGENQEKVYECPSCATIQVRKVVLPIHGSKLFLVMTSYHCFARQLLSSVCYTLINVLQTHFADCQRGASEVQEVQTLIHVVRHVQAARAEYHPTAATDGRDVCAGWRRGDGTGRSSAQNYFFCSRRVSQWRG